MNNLRGNKGQMIVNNESDLLQMGRISRDGEGKNQERASKRAEMFMYMHQLASMNAIVIYCKHILIKI